MSNVFSKVGGFFGKVFLGVVHVVHKADQGIDATVPELEMLLQEGASVSAIIPGIGPNVSQILNAGVTLLGQVKAVSDATDAELATAQQQVAALAPAGYSAVLIKQDILADVHELMSKYEAAYNASKQAVENATANPPATPAPPATSPTTK